MFSLIAHLASLKLYRAEPIDMLDSKKQGSYRVGLNSGKIKLICKAIFQTQRKSGE